MKIKKAKLEGLNLTLELENFSSRREAAKWLDDFKPGDFDIRQRHKRRSLDSNGYFWELVGQLAEATGEPKTEIYRRAIKEIGGNSTTVCVKKSAVKSLRRGWERNGLGWVTEETPSKIDGCTNVILYYGSSTYDSKQMQRLIDFVVQDCRALGIETLTPAELEALQ